MAIKAVSAKFIIATIITFVAIVIMLRLGFWQLNRADMKSQRLQQIETRQQQQPFSLDELLNLEGDLRDFPLQVTGQPVSKKLVLLDNKISAGQVGYEVLIPVRTDHGMLMVNAGWVKAPEYRQQLPDILLPEDLGLLQGMVSQPIKNPMITETLQAHEDWPKVIQQFDAEVLGQLLEEPVLPIVMLLSPQQNFGFERDWQPVVMPPEKHIAYAIQWFGLAVACLLVFIFACRKAFSEDKDK